MRAIIKFYLALLLLASGLEASGQIENSMLAASPSSTRGKASAKARKIKTPPINRPIPIVVTDIRDIGYGNLCVSEATRKMGFTFVPMPVNIEKRSKIRHFFNNQSARFKVTLKNGPFWQRKLKKNIKRCLQTTGDFTG